MLLIFFELLWLSCSIRGYHFSIRLIISGCMALSKSGLQSRAKFQDPGMFVIICEIKVNECPAKK